MESHVTPLTSASPCTYAFADALAAPPTATPSPGSARFLRPPTVLSPALRASLAAPGPGSPPPSTSNASAPTSPALAALPPWVPLVAAASSPARALPPSSPSQATESSSPQRGQLSPTATSHLARPIPSSPPPPTPPPPPLLSRLSPTSSPAVVAVANTPAFPKWPLSSPKAPSLGLEQATVPSLTSASAFPTSTALTPEASHSAPALLPAKSASPAAAQPRGNSERTVSNGKRIEPSFSCHDHDGRSVPTEGLPLAFAGGASPPLVTPPRSTPPGRPAHSPLWLPPPPPALPPPLHPRAGKLHGSPVHPAPAVVEQTARSDSYLRSLAAAAAAVTMAASPSPAEAVPARSRRGSMSQGSSSPLAGLITRVNFVRLDGSPYHGASPRTLSVPPPWPVRAHTALPAIASGAGASSPAVCSHFSSDLLSPAPPASSPIISALGDIDTPALHASITSLSPASFDAPPPLLLWCGRRCMRCLRRMPANIPCHARRAQHTTDSLPDTVTGPSTPPPADAGAAGAVESAAVVVAPAECRGVEMGVPGGLARQGGEGCSFERWHAGLLGTADSGPRGQRCAGTPGRGGGVNGGESANAD